MGLLSGQLLAARYRLSRRIAIGGMSEVWQAADTRLDRQVAVKVLRPELSGNPEFRHRFHAEARITASLNHPGIAAVHDYGEATRDPDGTPADAYPWAFLVMELVAGDSLAAILMRHQRLAADRTLDILGQAGDALQAAHERGLVHRDIKPGNILITPSGRVKLTDFGIARAVHAAPVTCTGMVMGTAHYICPEQAAGSETGPASDVYSLGVVGYECLAGQRPFVADNVVAVVMMHIRDRPPPLPQEVPPALCALIEAALVKDPRQRYGTGGEFAAAVAAVRAGHRPPLPSGVATSKLATGGMATSKLATSGVATSGVAGSATAMLPTPPSQRFPAGRGALRFAMALFGVLVLVLGGYLGRAALRSSATPAPSGALAGPASTDVPRAPVAPGTPQSSPREPAPEQPGPDPNNSDSEPPQVRINPPDYWGQWGSDAVRVARVHGLRPHVVDENGNLVDPDLRSQCRIIGVDPPSGLVPLGFPLELTCGRAE